MASSACLAADLPMVLTARWPSFSLYQLVELLLDSLIVPPLNSMQKEQACQNHAREYKMEINTSIYGPAKPRAQNRTENGYS
jgi:hypothetical protein